MHQTTNLYNGVGSSRLKTNKVAKMTYIARFKSKCLNLLLLKNNLTENENQIKLMCNTLHLEKIIHFFEL